MYWAFYSCKITIIRWKIAILIYAKNKNVGTHNLCFKANFWGGSNNE